MDLKLMRCFIITLGQHFVSVGSKDKLDIAKTFQQQNKRYV